MPDSKSVKSGVLLFLVVALLWRIKTSFNKLVFSDEVTIYRTEDVVSMPFPSVTLCLVPNETERARFWPESFNDVKSASSSFSQVILSARADLRNSGGQLMRM